MADITLVGVRLVVEGQEAATGQLAAFDAKAKATTESLKEMGGPGVTDGLQHLVVSVENASSSMDKGVGSTRTLKSELKDLDGTLSGLSNNLMGFTTHAIGYGALGFAGLGIAAVGFGVKAAASFEQTRISFDTMLGSVQRGDALFKSLQQYNLQTPFGLPDITRATQTLLQYGFTQQNVMPVLKTLTNVASAAPAGEGSDDLQRSALALGQISSASVIRGQDVNQLTQAGFPIVKLLAQVTGQTPAQLQGQLRGGGITLPSSQLVDAISAGGGTVLSPYASAAQRQSQSLTGQASNFVDILRMDLATASQPLADALAKNMTPISNALDGTLKQITPQLNEFFTMLAEKAPGAIEKAGPALKSLLDGLAHNGPMLVTFLHDVGALIPGLVRAGGDLLPIVDGMAKGFHELLDLPFGIGTGLVDGLLVALLGYNALKGTASIVKGMAAAIDTLTDAELRQSFAKGIGPGGKALAGVAGAAGLGLSATDAYKSGPSFSNVAGGAVSGAVLGATLGSVLPGPGTAVGAGVGALVGGGTAFLSGELGQHNHQHNVTIVTHDTKTMADQMDEYYRDQGRRAAQAYEQAYGR